MVDAKSPQNIVLEEIPDILLILLYGQPEEFFCLRLLMLKLRLIFMVEN